MKFLKIFGMTIKENNMTSKNIAIISTILSLLGGGCATIVNSSDIDSTVKVTSSMPVSFVVFDKHGKIVKQGAAPTDLYLQRDIGYFERPEYRFIAYMNGQEVSSAMLRASIAPSYIIGNFFSWGLLGWLIVDPLTGSMWTYDTSVDITPRTVLRDANIPLPQTTQQYQPQQYQPQQSPNNPWQQGQVHPQNSYQQQQYNPYQQQNYQPNVQPQPYQQPNQNYYYQNYPQNSYQQQTYSPPQVPYQQ